MSTFFNDIRYTLRQMRKSPGFTAIALLTLAFCIGANVVIFAVVDAILLRPLPFPEANRLVIVTKDYPGMDIEHMQCSLPNYYDWRKGITAFASTSALRSDSITVGEAGSPRRVLCERVSSEFFATLGVEPALGRFFTEAEIDDVRSNVVVLTDAYWRKHFNADPGIIGGDIRVDGKVATIVGVMPRHFRYLSSRAQLFLPLTSAAEDRAIYQRHNNSVQVIARLAPGASLDTAQAQIRAFDTQQLKNDPVAAQLKLKDIGYRVSVSSLRADHVRTVRPILLLLQGGALSLLLIGGVNLINLLLIRASVRAREFAVRKALGAARRDVVREVFVETVLLGAFGGTLGLCVSVFGINLLSILGTEELPLGAQVTFDGRVAAVAWFGSFLVGIVLAIPIIWFNLRQRLVLALRTECCGGTMSHAAQRLRHSFVVTQIALAFMLLMGAGLLCVSLRRVLAISPGFQPENVLSGHLVLPTSRYQNNPSRLAFSERLLGELHAQPGVTFASISTCAPFTSRATIHQSVVTVEGVVAQPGESLRAHTCSWVAGDYWRTLGIPLRAGRLLDKSDQQREQRVCVVDEAFAQRYWPQGNAIGHRLTEHSSFKEDEAFAIVGVVGDVKTNDLAETSALGAVYFPYRYNRAHDSIDVFICTRLAPAVLASVLQKTVHRLDPELPVDDIYTMQARIDASLIQRRSPALLAGIFASVALLLTAIGTYGVVAYAVTQRSREIGVRMALGAMPQQVLTHFLGVSAKLLLLGLFFGVPGAWVVGRAMEGFLFGVSSIHTGMLAGTISLIVLAVLLACFFPARRASKIDPMKVLRYE